MPQGSKGVQRDTFFLFFSLHVVQHSPFLSMITLISNRSLYSFSYIFPECIYWKKKKVKKKWWEEKKSESKELTRNIQDWHWGCAFKHDGKMGLTPSRSFCHLCPLREKCYLKGSEHLEAILKPVAKSYTPILIPSCFDILYSGLQRQFVVL